jgi:hypothetical protein
VRLTPAALTYQITLRVAVAENLVGVQYSNKGNSKENPSETFLTMPPWDMHFQRQPAPRLTYWLAFQSRRCPPRRTPRVSVQILVNGKVKQQDSSEGGAAECSLEL